MIIYAGIEIVGTILFLVAMLVASYFLARSVLKERRKIREEKEMKMEGVISKAAISSIIASNIARVGKDVPFSVFYIDMDRFAEYVNAFGPKEADRILEKIVKNMESVLPKGIKIARYQSDEFMIFIPGTFDRSDSLEYASKIKDAISRPIKLFGDTQITATASIAVVFYPMHGETLKELMSSMQIALYLIKKSGGNAVRIYSNDMGEQGGEHIEYYYQIKHAIQHKEFQLYYQPIIDVKNKEIYGVETLIRWNHPEHGMLPPNQFLGVMEQSGDIHWIGLWGLETLIKTYQELDQDFPNRKLNLTLNLSPKQLINELLPTDFNKILKKYRMNPEVIILEIIEFALFEKETTIFKNVKKLKDMGFKIAIDGFGLDYQTLSKAEKLDIDIVKLDNEFLQVEEYMKSKFASLLVEFAGKNKYDVICESIEDEAMMKEAVNYNINYLQGYYLAKPMSAEALKGYIATEHWKSLI